jgi:hypothetical protein
VRFSVLDQQVELEWKLDYQEVIVNRCRVVELRTLARYTLNTTIVSKAGIRKEAGVRWWWRGRFGVEA